MSQPKLDVCLKITWIHFITFPENLLALLSLFFVKSEEIISLHLCSFHWLLPRRNKDNNLIACKVFNWQNIDLLRIPSIRVQCRILYSTLSVFKINVSIVLSLFFRNHDDLWPICVLHMNSNIPFPPLPLKLKVYWCKDITHGNKKEFECWLRTIYCRSSYDRQGGKELNFAIYWNVEWI